MTFGTAVTCMHTHSAVAAEAAAGMAAAAAQAPLPPSSSAAVAGRLGSMGASGFPSPLPKDWKQGARELPPGKGARDCSAAPPSAAAVAAVVAAAVVDAHDSLDRAVLKALRLGPASIG